MVVVAALVLLVGPRVPARQAAPGTDTVTRAIASLERAVAGNDVAAFRALSSPLLPDLEALAFEISLLGGGITTATARERDREIVGTATHVLVELLADRGGSGQISTWQVVWTPTPAGPRMTRLRRVSVVNGLHRLALDTTVAYAVKDFTFTATDLRLTMSKGVAFEARTADGITAMVLRGDGRMQFTPPDPIERHQLVRFSKHEALDETVEAAFIRLNPFDVDALIADGHLTRIEPMNRDVSRARAIFNQWSARSYSIGLGDLSPERWSLLPSSGDTLVDMQTRRYDWLTYARSSSQREDVSLFDRENRKNLSIYASPEKIATRGRFYSEDDGRAYDVEHYELNVRFDPETLSVRGTGTMRVRVLQHDAETLTVKLAESLGVSSLTEATYGRLLHLRIVGQDSLIVSLPEPQPVGRVLTFSFAYNGTLPPQSLTREAAEVSAEPNGQDFVAQPEPNYAYSVNSFWYPQNSVTDYATARIRVSVPQEYEAVCSGTRISEGSAGLDHVSAYATDTPARYLTAIISRLEAVPSSSITLPSGKALTVDARATPRQSWSAGSLTSRAAAVMSFYTSIIGEAPYPSLTLLALEADLPGGHSPAYMAAINQPMPTTTFTWRNDPIAFDNTFPNFYLAHEIAHQWWGQAIGVKSYHDQWLSEGLAQYFAWLYAGADRGPAVQAQILERMRQSVRKYGDSGPIWLGYRLGHVVGDGSNYRAIVYNKSVLALEALRAELGEDVFRAGLRRFYRDWRFRKAGTDDFRRAFEAEAGRPLGAFFDAWILGAGTL